ncbi:VrrA/YqfQ family protein [Neobacillus dielmonensis]|uniref:VrrA/YqfQ family protein n=1 Tax=Neobacillus dielmonensis TaxID=1347369 RepID=UPI000694B9BD|nr:VrrA/YqfQ family protein [Neobacillus dielmonensis]
MQPRQMLPMQGVRPGPFSANNPMMRPGPNMFGGVNQLMGQGLGGFPGRNPMMPPGGPFGGMMGGRQQGMGGNGLLSRLLGRGNQMRGAGNLMGMGMQGAGRAGGGGLLQSLTNPNGLAGILNNTQQVIRTAQTITPMIQQYGPLVKSLPGLWKLYRGLKNAPTESEDSGDKKETTKSEEETPRTSSRSRSRSKSQRNQRSKGESRISSQEKSPPTKEKYVQKGASVPKLYI